jgi:transposase-like protein
MSSVLNEPRFQSEEAAFDYVEAHVWPDGRVCPHCGVVGDSGALKGKTNRVGLYKCYSCRKPFTVKVGTIFESSHVKLHLWLQAMHLVCSSKKGISANQLHRTLGVTLKTAWFMGHRIREAMRSGDLSPMGGAGQTVEADETFIGSKQGFAKPHGGWGHKNVVLTLVERGGSARSFHVEAVAVKEIAPIVRANIARESKLMTDEASQYTRVGREFSGHATVDHGRKEYGYVDRATGFNANTNTVEGHYSIFKRGMQGVYQHCQEKHLHRYLAEFDFRYSNRVKLGIGDVARADLALKGIVGKRLTYQTIN